MLFIFNLLIWCITIDLRIFEESLHPWNKPNLIVVYELFDVLLNSEILHILIIQSLFSTTRNRHYREESVCMPNHSVMFNFLQSYEL